jgi:hypothetical protein
VRERALSLYARLIRRKPRHSARVRVTSPRLAGHDFCNSLRKERNLEPETRMADNTRKTNQNVQRQRQGDKMGIGAEQGQERQGVGKPHQQREEADQERDRMTQPTGGDLSEISKGITDDLDEDDLDEDDLDEDDLDDEDEEHDRITQRSPTQEG